MSLLDKARSLSLARPIRAQVSQDEVELVLAWLKGEVATFQANKVMKNFTTRAGIVLLYAYKQGLIKIR